MTVMPWIPNQTGHGIVIRRPEIRRVHSGVDARDVQKNTRFQLLLVEAVLHEITDTHDALQLVVLDDRQVTDPRYRHCRKHSIHAIGGATTEDGRRLITRTSFPFAITGSWILAVGGPASASCSSPIRR